MPLKVELRPGERIIIGTAVIRNGDSRIRFFIEGEAPILREKDILTPTSADTPAKNVYFALQLMYLSPDEKKGHEAYFGLVDAFLRAAPSSAPIVAEMNNHILNGELYKALKTAQRLIIYEGDLVSHATGRSGLRQDRAGDAAAAASRGPAPDEGRHATAGHPG